MQGTDAPSSPSIGVRLGDNPVSPSLLGPDENPPSPFDPCPIAGSPVPELPRSDDDEGRSPVSAVHVEPSGQSVGIEADTRPLERDESPASISAASSTPVTLVNGVVVQLRRAGSSRASRAARPSEPSQASQTFVTSIIEKLEQSLRMQKRVRIQNGEASKYRHVSGGSKGPGVRAAKAEDQAKTNHLASLKARGVDNDQEASYLLAGFLGEKCYDRLAADALRTNAVHASILRRRDTQGVRNAR